MKNRLAALAGALLAAGLLSTPAHAAVSVNIDIGIPPPPVRVEVAPAVRAGFIWAPGYWRWEGRQHVWVGGRWMAARPGYRWVPERWEPRGGRYVFVPGRWEGEARAAEHHYEPEHHDNGRHEGWKKHH